MSAPSSASCWRTTPWCLRGLVATSILVNGCFVLYYDWAFLGGHVICVVAVLLLAAFRPLWGLAMAMVWSLLVWSNIRWSCFDIPPEVTAVKVGGSVKETLARYGPPEKSVATFGQASHIDRDMVGPMWIDANDPAMMFRLWGYRVWIAYRGDTICAVSRRRYADWAVGR
jgi:hypothetical protein